MKVEIWSDVVCPWCYIGKRKFDRAVAMLREKGVDEPIEVRFRAYQLDPSAPPGATMPAVEGYARKFGGEERAREIIAHVTRAAADTGIEFHMEKALRANTLLAHRAIHFALAHHDEATHRAVKERLMKAYFTDGLNVGDPDVVADCAAECGVDRARLREWLDTSEGADDVRADIEGAMLREISGVPAFVIDDQFLVPGAQEPETFVTIFEKVLARR